MIQLDVLGYRIVDLLGRSGRPVIMITNLDYLMGDQGLEIKHPDSAVLRFDYVLGRFTGYLGDEPEGVRDIAERVYNTLNAVNIVNGLA